MKEDNLYRPIEPSYTPDGLKAALAHNEREAAKLDDPRTEYPYAKSLALRVSDELRDVHSKLASNTAASTALEQQHGTLSDLLRFAEVQAAAEGAAPADRVRYLQLRELLKAQLEATRQQEAALDREREQLSALLPPRLDGNPYMRLFEGVDMLLARSDCANMREAALQREYQELQEELKRITSIIGDGTAASVPEELLASSRARQRDIKLARNQALLVAYRKEKEALEAALGPRSAPGPSLPWKALWATLERIGSTREGVMRQRDGLAAALNALPASGSSSGGSHGEEAQVRQQLEELLAASDRILAALSSKGGSPGWATCRSCCRVHL